MAKPSKTPRSPPAGDTWTIAAAKARLSEVVDRAQAGPQTITRNGKPSAVIVSAEEWARKTVRKGTLAEFLLASRGADLDLERQRDAPRDVML
jgi:prevent-host-death family protein